jgi:hypothetical protein
VVLVLVQEAVHVVLHLRDTVSARGCGSCICGRDGP